MVSLSARGVGTAFVMAAKKNAECYLPSSLFFLEKQKFSLDFFQLAKRGTEDGLLKKVKWCWVTF